MKTLPEELTYWRIGAQCCKCVTTTYGPSNAVHSLYLFKTLVILVTREINEIQFQNARNGLCAVNAATVANTKDRGIQAKLVGTYVNTRAKSRTK